jgi:hypothetical protein
MKAEDDCKVERKHTLKLRHAMEQRPSQELLWELQQEKALLQAQVQELEASVQVGLPSAHQQGRLFEQCGEGPAGRHGPPQPGHCPSPSSGEEAEQEQPLHPGAGGGLAPGTAGPPGAGQHHLLPAQGPSPGRGPPHPGTSMGQMDTGPGEAKPVATGTCMESRFWDFHSTPFLHPLLEM